MLDAKGMVRPRPKTGTTVLPQSQWNLLDQDGIRWRVAGPEGLRPLRELSDLRAAVEIFAARGCSEYASDDQVLALHHTCDDMAHAAPAGDHRAFTAADVAFHTTILEASGNAVFSNFAWPFAAFLHAREDRHTLADQVGTPSWTRIEASSQPLRTMMAAWPNG